MFKKFKLIFCIILINYFSSKCSYKQEFNNLLLQGIPKWISNQILGDFENFKNKSVSKNDINNSFAKLSKRSSFVKFKIVDNHVSFSGNLRVGDFERANIIKGLLTDLKLSTKLPNVEFIVFLGDSNSSNDYDIPILSFNKDVIKDKNVVLIPDPNTIDFIKQKRIYEVYAGRKIYKWKDKSPTAFWRGSTTKYFHTTYEDSARFKIVTLSKQFPNLINAKFHFTWDKDLYAKLIRLNFIGPTVSIKDHLAYKYQIVVDGNVSSWDRTWWVLFSDCLMLKQNSDHMQWYYQSLQPYIHYIPFQNNVADLIEKVKWAQSHDNEVQIIIKAANEFANSNLKYVNLLLYMYVVINEYSKLQKN